MTLAFTRLDVSPWEFFNVVVDEGAGNGFGVLLCEQSGEEDCEVLNFI